MIVGCGKLDAYDYVLKRRPDVLDPVLPRDKAIAEYRLKNAFCNVAIALEHIALVACELGLGTCWIREFRDYEINKILELPLNYQVVALMAVGYPAKEARPPGRKALEKIVWDTFFSKVDPIR